ncbi:Mu-like prophage protein gp36 [Elysia marginata]|uniref:Mu-like prophage protein gp36 n=1 Tax=Elysia marginata TaxID=1093978 RepID=A0AAV4GWJ4_9GAST|nr:Mu-like prophage protein gp36 [Elysia marginata]
MAIQDAFYNAITEDRNSTVVNTSESIALAKIKTALSGRYDTDAVFGSTGEQRDPIIIHHTLNIFIYLLYQRFDPRKIPENRKAFYHETIDFLEDVAKGKITLDVQKAEQTETEIAYKKMDIKDYNL